jgi:hypothetical protein
VTEPPGDDTDAVDPAARRPRSARRRRLLRAALVLVVLGVWLAACAVLLIRARDDAANGLDSVSVAEKHSSPADLLAGRPAARLADAKESFAAARRRLHNPILTPLRWLPVGGRQLRAATAMAHTAEEVSAVGSDAVVEARTALEQPHDTPSDRIDLLRRLSQISAKAETRLRTVNLGPSKALVGALADKRAELADRLDQVRDALADGTAVSQGLADLLQGPRRYLVLAANDAEMRSGSGMFLSAGELNITNGEMHLGEFRSTGDIQIPPPQAPPIGDADFAARWGFLNPNREWRNLAASPRFPASAQLATRMWPVSTGLAPPDGVLALDPVGLKALLKATGPVDLGAGRTVTADSVVPLLLHDQYAGLPAPSAKFDAVQAARREQLGLIAKLVVDKLTASSIDIADVAESLAEAARGRHLLAWSARPDDSQVWSRARVDGALTEKSLLLSVLNRGGNKLDYFLDVESRLVLQPVPGEEQAVLTVNLTNRVPDGENVYVAGPYPGSGVGANDYTGVFSVNLPGFAGRVTVDGFETFAAAGPDGPTQVVAVPVIVPKGATKTIVVRFHLPRRGSLRVEAAARVPTTKWVAPGESWSDDRARTVSWG